MLNFLSPMRGNLKTILMCGLLGALACGCASSVSMSTWEKGVEKYANDKGDPGALRDVTLKGDRRGFAVIGQADPEKSTDANGVLLGHRDVAGQPCFIYLVGIVKNQKVSDIHLAAGTFKDGKAHWQTGKKDSEATNIYKHYNEGLWHKTHGPKDEPPAAYTTFPRDEDKFDLAINGPTIVVTHPASGAKWQLDLAKPH